MRSAEELRKTLARIDGLGYKAYKDITSREGYDFGEVVLIIDYAQGDPFAAPSRMRVRLRHDFPAETFCNKSREVALRDYLTRAFVAATGKEAAGDRGSGKSGMIAMDRPAQEVLERLSVLIDAQWLEARFTMGLPAFGRRIAGQQAQQMIFEELPAIVRRSLRYRSLNRERLERHIKTVEDADALRGQLPQRGLVAFVADGALLPRRSGVDERPAAQGKRFKSPESLRIQFQLPNQSVSGMGIPTGITLIVGGGYHGKSTLLHALEKGVYNHIPGDGRELAISDPNAVKIRAEDGRSVAGVDISPFINNLPGKIDTAFFSTDNASGSTSQAANIMEAIEAGASCLLMDEDTLATNLMIRDRRMQLLIAKEHEPITPFVDRARELYEARGVSTIIVVGGLGAYLDIADTVIRMIEYEPQEVTAEARQIAHNNPDAREREGKGDFGAPHIRIPEPNSIDPSRGKREKIKAHGVDTLEFGTERADLRAVEQLVDPSQLRAIGLALNYARRYMGQKTTAETLDLVMEAIERKGLDVLTQPQGDLALFRRHELAAALNRLRSLRVRRADK